LDGETLVTVQAYKTSLVPRSLQLLDLAEFVKSVTLGCDVAYVEEPLVGRGVRASLRIAQVAGAVLSHLSIPAYLVSNTAWKKQVIGSGNANKDRISTWLDETHPCYFADCDGDQDQADATCIALYGRQQQQLAARIRTDSHLSRT